MVLCVCRHGNNNNGIIIYSCRSLVDDKLVVDTGRIKYTAVLGEKGSLTTREIKMKVFVQQNSYTWSRVVRSIFKSRIRRNYGSTCCGKIRNLG